ncbi:hypothetical protein VTL71DRAFT_13745 [Oculimacula yallundae]|uniref:Uncharacterized protein n=1 Tax=Oculimacula yallundae TaxID=86028 RepID=A0ABR4CLB6_9HELO
MVMTPAAPSPHIALAAINPTQDEAAAIKINPTLRMPEASKYGIRRPMWSETRANSGWNVKDVRRKAFTGHVQRFVRLNDEAIAMCTDAESPESRDVDCAKWRNEHYDNFMSFPVKLGLLTKFDRRIAKFLVNT